ncbi:MAG: tetratricopeptide repeat protein [Patescibacteria group bacterium]
MPFLNKTIPSEEMYQSILTKMSLFLLFGGTLLMPVFFLPLTRDVFHLPKQLLLSMLVLVALLCWLLQVAISKRLLVRRTILDLPLLAFGAVTLIASIVSRSPSLSFLGSTDHFVLHAMFLFSLLLWFWLCIQYIRDFAWLERFISVFLLSGFFAGILFLGRDSVFISLSDIFRVNPVSDVNSLFGIFMAIVGTLALGLLFIRGRSWYAQILPIATALVSLATLLKLGFTIPWLVLAVGSALLVVLGVTLLAESRIVPLSLVFFVFLTSILFVFFGSPSFLKDQIPVEVALGMRSSFSIAGETVLENAKTFLLGTGPSTFIFDFSSHRPSEFNVNQFAWNIRFFQPYNVFLAFAAESGILGLVSFLFIVLFGIGSIFSAWLKTRPSVWQRVRERISHEHSREPIRLESFVIAAAWIAATVGAGISFYDTVLWFSWWWLLAAAILGVSLLAPDVIREREVLLQVSPQYALALSFGMVLLFTAVVIFGSFGGRMFLAEAAYTKAVQMPGGDAAEAEINKAIAYRRQYIPYRIARARLYLQKARDESQKSSPDVNVIAELVSVAVNEARYAADREPNNIETWDTLATMYLNARSFAPEANAWAKDALARAIALEPTNPLFYWEMGGVHEFAGALEEAEKSYKMAIDLKPDYLAPYVSLSQVYESQNHLDDALLLFQPVLPIIVNEPDVLFHVGRIAYNRRKEGDTELAEQLWKRVLEINPNYSNALYSLGLLYERKGDRNTAIGYFQKVRSIDPGNEDVKRKIQQLLGS